MFWISNGTRTSVSWGMSEGEGRWGPMHTASRKGAAAPPWGQRPRAAYRGIWGTPQNGTCSSKPIVRSVSDRDGYGLICHRRVDPVAKDFLNLAITDQKSIRPLYLAVPCDWKASIACLQAYVNAFFVALFDCCDGGESAITNEIRPLGSKFMFRLSGSNSSSSLHTR